MNRWTRLPTLLAAVVLHVALLFTVTVTTQVRQQREDTSVFKIVDVEAFVPPPEPEPEPEEPPPPEEEVPIVVDEPAETVIETDEEVPPPPPPAPAAPQPVIEFLPQHRISVPPRIDQDTLASRIVYPTLANRSGIEGVVYLELFIDAEGTIHRIDILREPGYGLAEAAIAAFEGLTVTPAEANGIPVAVRYRYPVRFVLR